MCFSCISSTFIESAKGLHIMGGHYITNSVIGELCKINWDFNLNTICH